FPNLALGITGSISASGRQPVSKDFAARSRPEGICELQHAGLDIRNRSVNTGSIGKQAQPCLRVGHDCVAGYSPSLAKPFIVSKQECSVFLQWTSQVPPELIALKRTLRVFEEVARIESAVA